MRICICGSRDFDTEENFRTLERVLENLLMELKIKKQEVEIVSGAASGADSLGAAYALKNDIELKLFKADWENQGKSAGFIRNKDMAIYSDLFVVFWDTISKGTKNMIDNIKKLDKEYYIYTFDGDKIFDYIHDSQKTH